MSHRDELLDLARSLHSQAEGRGLSKRNLRQLADDYQREAELLLKIRREREQKKQDHAA